MDLKVFPLIVSTGTNGFAAAAQLRKRFVRIGQLRDRGAEIDGLFRTAYEWPQHLYRWALGILCAAGAVALIGGLLRLVDSRAFPAAQGFFENYGAAVAIVGILLWFIASVEGFTRLVLFAKAAIAILRPSILSSPSWYNMIQLFADSPQPLFLCKIGVERLSDVVMQKLLAGAYQDNNFASAPTQLASDERANVALFGCMIEQEHWDRGFQRRDWAPFYRALAECREDGQSIFSPDYLRRVHMGTGATRDFYQIIRTAANPALVSAAQPELPESATVSSDVGEALNVLVDRYSGSAVNLANADLTGRHFNIERAFAEASSFPLLRSDSMRPQFLKLLVRWDVWPGIQPGRFIYPFSARIAALLLDSGALVTLDDSDRLTFRTEDQRMIVREGVRRVVANVERLLMSDSVNGARAYYSALRNEQAHPAEWELAQRVDYVLWSEARNRAAADTFEDWSIGKDGFVERKG
ncbi:MAG: hypothetical protein IH602_05680 [Bryobacteraceae bacterium]|nr:hypothetical protein [Bryobacteraceae bacterium]